MFINKNGVFGVNLYCLVDEEIVVLGLNIGYRWKVIGCRLWVIGFKKVMFVDLWWIDLLLLS